MNREERITLYEQMFDTVNAVLSNIESDLKQLDACEVLVKGLEAYYTSEEWMSDFEADEAGELPADLKRGVLSEDGIYDLLERFEQLKDKMVETAKGKTVTRDITLAITPQMVNNAAENEKKSLVGHLGTHFDVMDKIFPLNYINRKAVVFDVTDIKGRDIDVDDIDFDLIEPGMFVAFNSGFMKQAPYGTAAYHHEHPQLSKQLIEALIEEEISIIGIDFAGVRRGSEHTQYDQYCADGGVFIVENLCDLNGLSEVKDLVIHTYPMRYEGVTGLPCRVIAEYAK